MTTDAYPTSFSAVEGWSNNQRVPILEGRRKYIQLLTLRAVASSAFLRQRLVFKGGNALEFFYVDNRTTTDLDFSLLGAPGDLVVLKETLQSRLSTALERMDDGAGTVVRFQGIEQRPSGANRTRVTFRVRVAWAAPDQTLQRQNLLSGRSGAQILDLDISINENVCAFAETFIGDMPQPINVSTIEDIVAEKLRALLQQPIRRRTRSQDVLDIATISRLLDLDLTLVSRFLPEKCVDRDVEPSKSAFRDPEVRSRSATGYDYLKDTVRHTFIPFDEAWETVLALVDRLDIPA